MCRSVFQLQCQAVHEEYLVGNFPPNSTILHPKTPEFGYSQWRTQEFFFGGGSVQQIQLRIEDRENGDLGGGSPLVRGSEGSCNLVQEISFHRVKYS